MGGKFWFFTDPALLKAQGDADAFGPLPPLAGDDRFRITHRHPTTATGAPAIAICDGMVCAQKDNSGALTLILKPSDTPPFEAPVVSYFIYKGIDSAADHKGGLTFDASFPTDNSALPKPFTDERPIERLFDYPHGAPQWAVVTAGEKIGAFLGKTCGLEIVLQRLGYKPTLDFARRPDNIISVASLAATNGGAAWQADDRAYFEHWHNKEQVLAYLDPAAYFGAFVQAKLYTSDGTDKDKVKGKDVYDNILATFANRNLAWLDIRNNYNCSFNLFGLYDDTIRFTSPKGSNPIATSVNTRSESWPLGKLEIDDVPGHRKGRLHRTLLTLPAGSGKAPMVLLSKGFAAGFGTEKRKFKIPAISADADVPGFLKPMRLAFPAKEVNGQDVFIASYTRINLYEQKSDAGTSATPLSVAGDEPLDGLFRLGDLRLDWDFSNHSLQFEIYPEEILVEFGSVAYAGGVGVAEDTSYIALFAFPTTFLRKGPGGSRQQGVSSLTNRFEDGAGSFQDWLKAAFPTSLFTKTTIDTGTATEIDIPIARRQPPGDGVQLTAYGHVGDYCLLFLYKADHASLLAKIDGAAAPTPDWPCFSTIASATKKTDATTHASYTERNLSATGYQPASTSTKIEKYTLSWVRRTAEYADV